MRIIFDSPDVFSIILTQNIYKEENKKETIEKIKLFLLKYNQYYQILKAGFYQIEVGFHELVGTILKITLLDDFDLGDNNIDMKIIFIGKQDIAMELEEIPYSIKEIYSYKEKFYLLEEQLTPQRFYQFLEHSHFLWGEEVKRLKPKLKKICIKKDQLV